MLAASNSVPSRRDWIVGVLWIVAMLGVHFHFARVAWSTERLSGQEFRQAQTAISSFFIQREHNFSLAYPTPVLGPPWSIPMEFPLYQWTTVVVSNVAHLPLVEAARWVSLLSFYAALGALYALLGWAGLSSSRRLLAIGVAMVSPLYILYSRAFMIESMALMFALWYLYAFIRAMAQPRHAGWFLAVNLIGIAGALTKVTTFMVYVIPAAIVGAVYLWRARPGAAGGSWRRFGATAAFGIIGLTLAPALFAALWVSYGDNVKALNFSASFLNAVSMIPFNFGTWAERLTGEFYRGLFNHWREVLQPTFLTLGTIVVSAVFGRRTLVAALLGLFAASQMIFAYLYYAHDYYFYASGLLLTLATGVAIVALQDFLQRWRALFWLPWALAIAVVVLQLKHYQREFLPDQANTIPGGEHTLLIKQLTDPDDMIVVVGDDWSSVIPYYSQRRALMIPGYREDNDAYLTRAFAELRDYRVGALVISKRSLSFQTLVDRAERTLGIMPGSVATYRDFVLFFHQDHFERVNKYLQDNAKGRYNELRLSPRESLGSHTHVTLKQVDVATFPEQSHFAQMSPKPVYNRNLWATTASMMVGNVRRFWAHAPSEVVFHVPPGRHHLFAQYGIHEGAFLNKKPPNTDGVTFSVLVRQPNHADRLLVSSFLNPQEIPADRTVHSFYFNFNMPADAELILQAGPGHSDNNAFDWAYWGKVEIK